MKEEILNKFGEKLLQYAESAEMFASKEVPLYVEELLKFRVLENYIQIGAWVGAIALTSSFLAASLLWWKAKEWGEYESGPAVTTITVSILLGAFLLLGGAFSVSNLTEIYKIKVAPRVFIIDYIRSGK